MIQIMDPSWFKSPVFKLWTFNPEGANIYSVIQLFN